MSTGNVRVKKKLFLCAMTITNILKGDKNMAIKRFRDYEKTQAYGDYDVLPKGGYVVKILGAELCSNSVVQYV